MLHIPRVIIAGTHSGVGKTTIATGIMAALRKRGLRVQGFKTGPDYIDPGYHTLVTGRTSRNLDAFMLSPDILAALFQKAAVQADISIIEGVMGLFDGGRGGIGSTANIAKMLRVPVILIVDVQAMADSAAAVVHGFKNFESAVELTGVIVNRAGSERHYQIVKEAIEDKTGLAVLGCLGKNEKLSLPERHLGLLPAGEEARGEWCAELALKIEEHLDLDRLLILARSAALLKNTGMVKKLSFPEVRVAVARDTAFTFYYQDGLDVLAELGAELVEFSPLQDRMLPDNIDGMILGGGFPEMFVQKLAANQTLRHSIRAAAADGMPIYAECGGLMYLCRQIVDFEGHRNELVGLVPAVCRMQKKRAALGYIEAQACRDTLLCAQGETLRGHEFHFSVMTPDRADFPWAFIFKRSRDGTIYPGGYCTENLLASYLHCHFAGNPASARRFVDKCRTYKKNRMVNDKAGGIHGGE